MKIDDIFLQFWTTHWSSKLILVPNLLEKLLYKLETILTVYNVNFKKAINHNKSERFSYKRYSTQGDHNRWHLKGPLSAE